MTDKIPEALAVLKRAVGDQPDAPEGMTNAQAIKAFSGLIEASKRTVDAAEPKHLGSIEYRLMKALAAVENLK